MFLFRFLNEFEISISLHTFLFSSSQSTESNNQIKQVTGDSYEEACNILSVWF